jgi:hypothetical protein
MFKTGIVEDGIVIAWSDKKSAIKSMHNDNILLILNTIENVLAVKIERSAKKEKIEEKVYVDEPEPAVYVRDESLRAKQLSELHFERIKEEKERARKKLSTFESTEATQSINYGYPKLQQPPDTNNDPRKKALKRIKQAKE